MIVSRCGDGTKARWGPNGAVNCRIFACKCKPSKNYPALHGTSNTRRAGCAKINCQLGMYFLEALYLLTSGKSCEGRPLLKNRRRALLSVNKNLKQTSLGRDLLIGIASSGPKIPELTAEERRRSVFKSPPTIICIPTGWNYHNGPL